MKELSIVVLIDESGNTSINGTRYFVMVAVISQRSRNLLETSKLFDKNIREEKFHNTEPTRRMRILSSISKSKIKIAYVCIDKKKSKIDHIVDNELYASTFNILINNVSKAYWRTDAKIMIDDTRQIDAETMISITKACTMNIISCKKYNSSSNRCIQIADFVAGSIFAKYEHNDNRYFNLLKEKILRP